MKDVVNRLKEKGLYIATMESCTGGGVANAITNIPGASEILKFSAVTYSNEYKINMGVSSDTIDKYSVYSMEVAKEMSKAISDFAFFGSVGLFPCEPIFTVKTHIVNGQKCHFWLTESQ